MIRLFEKSKLTPKNFLFWKNAKSKLKYKSYILIFQEDSLIAHKIRNSITFTSLNKSKWNEYKFSFRQKHNLRGQKI